MDILKIAESMPPRPAPISATGQASGKQAAPPTLIECPACGKRVSPSAAACPACAHPIRPERTNPGAINLRDPVHVAGLIVCAGVLLWVAAMVVSAIVYQLGG